MKHLTLIVIVFFIVLNVSGQYRNVASTSELASIINEKYPDSLSKISAAYAWVTSNIRYSNKGIFAMNNSINPRDEIDMAFKNRSGVCENFAAIFTDLCRKMGFRSEVIHGYANHNDNSDDDGHSWAVVFVDNDWFLFDPTWDIGKTSGFKFFKKTGNEFIETHTPFDPLWRIQNYPNSNRKGNKLLYVNYKDSIDIYLASDSLIRLESATRRITKSKIDRTSTDTHLKVLKNDLEIKREEEQMEWFNLAVEKMNTATRILNNFIDLRNGNFNTVTDFSSLHLMLESMDRELDSANSFLDKVDQSKATLVYGTAPAREQLKKLRTKHSDQIFFLNKFLAENRR